MPLRRSYVNIKHIVGKNRTIRLSQGVRIFLPEIVEIVNIILAKILTQILQKYLFLLIHLHIHLQVRTHTHACLYLSPSGENLDVFITFKAATQICVYVYILNFIISSHTQTHTR